MRTMLWGSSHRLQNAELPLALAGGYLEGGVDDESERQCNDDDEHVEQAQKLYKFSSCVIVDEVVVHQRGVGFDVVEPPIWKVLIAYAELVNRERLQELTDILHAVLFEHHIYLIGAVLELALVV